MSASSHGVIRVGVGGWTYEPWRGAFYPPGLPQKQELAHAARALTTIEINGTYYGSQKPESFARWRDNAAGLRLRGEGAALCHEPPRAGGGGRVNRAVFWQRRDGAQGQARTR